jgi:hypothetical protein
MHSPRAPSAPHVRLDYDYAVDESLAERDLTATRELEALGRQVSDLNSVPATRDGHPAR